MQRRIAALLLLALGSAAPVAAQNPASLGLLGHFQGYTFDKALGISAANLLLAPVAFELPLGRSLSLDMYGAYAHGSVEVSDLVYTLSGFVDTRLRASWNATPWAMFTVGLNLPTGNASHTTEEAVVTNVLATEVLGFREASWGLGFGVTSGLATAARIGGLGIGLGGSYRVASEYEPSADSALSYTPGNETRVRLAIDTDLGSSKLTMGVTYQYYAQDQLNGRDLFQPGNRWRGDISYSFRAGASSTWTLFAADIWRQHGDVRLEFNDGQGNVVRDSTFTTGQQNVLVAGIAGAIRLSSTLSLRPTADVRWLSREEDGGEGWIAGFGTDLPLRWGAVDLFPSAKFYYGQLQSGSALWHRALGGEAGLSLRFGR